MGGTVTEGYRWKVRGLACVMEGGGFKWRKELLSSVAFL